MDRLAEIQARLAQIAEEIMNPENDFDALSREADELEKEARSLRESAETRNARAEEVRSMFSDGEGIAAPLPQIVPETRVYTADSPEYRNAFYRQAAREGGIDLGDLTEEETRAFTYVTSNSEVIIPTTLQNRIIDLVSEETSIYADLDIQGLSGVFEVPRLIEIVKGDAKRTAENTGNEDEEDKFDLISLTGEEFRKHAKIGRKVQIQSIDAFESWLTSHILKRIYVAMNKYVFDRLEDDDFGIADASKVEVTGELTDDDILKALACVRGGVVKVYANNTTIYTHIAAVKDKNGRPIYTESSMTDPRDAGVVRGKKLRVDDTLPDGVIWIGAPSTIEANLFEAPNIASDVDVITRQKVVAGYTLFDCILADPRGFAKIQIGA